MKAFPSNDVSKISHELTKAFPKLFQSNVLDNVVVEFAEYESIDASLLEKVRNETYLRICMHVKTGEIGFYKLINVIEAKEKECFESSDLSQNVLQNYTQSDGEQFVPVHLKNLSLEFPHAIVLDPDIANTSQSDLFTVIKIKFANQLSFWKLSSRDCLLMKKLSKKYWWTFLIS